MTRRHLALFLFVFAGVCQGTGVWFKTPAQLKANSPEWALLKFGIFSRAGGLKVVSSLEDCPTPTPLFAWVTHRLSARETLSPAAGRRLGTELNEKLGACFSGVEINAEPMPSLAPWFLEFAKEVRAALDKKYVLHVATPAEWDASMRLHLLTAIDGVDLMIYDTGARNAPAYKRHVREALNFGIGAPADKGITFGFPAYPDKTKKHRRGVEVLANVQALLDEEPGLRRAFCGKRRRVAIYCGETMTAEESKAAALLTCPE